VAAGQVYSANRRPGTSRSWSKRRNRMSAMCSWSMVSRSASPCRQISTSRWTGSHARSAC